MGTTNLFVELVVIEAGVLIWLTLLMFTVLGLPSVIINESIQIAFTIPILATIYVAGIIWDRIEVLYSKKPGWIVGVRSSSKTNRTTTTLVESS